MILILLSLIFAPCLSEGPEATMCYWDASQAGNGLGTSFIALTEGITLYPTTNGR